MGKSKAKMVIVLLESLAGTSHKRVMTRPRLADKLEAYSYDPLVQQWVIYREIRKLKSIKSGAD